MTSEEEIRLIRESERGSKARAIIESDLFKEAFHAVETAILDKWKDAPIRDLEGQQALKMMHKLLADVKNHITEAMEHGKMASRILEEERTLANRAKDAIRAFRR
jgi:hypothetical protein